MRNKLKEIDGERQTFYGEFVRLGVKNGFRGTVETVLFKSIYDSNNKFITDHLWFNLTRGFEKLFLKPGDKVQFDARVQSYIKGYKGSRKEVLNSAKGVQKTDYQLTRPSRIVKLKNL